MVRMKNCAVPGFLLLVLAVGALGSLVEMHDCANNVGQDHVLITVNNSKIGRCGGSLLSPEWVLTAAHCNTSKLQVILGHSPSKDGEIRDVIAAEQYKPTDGSQPHNILLLKISKASEKSSKLAIKLPDSTVTLKDKTAQFYSWVIPDIDKDGKMTPKHLKCSQLSVGECKNVEYNYKQGVPKELDQIKHALFCTKAKEGCGWYSGGSLVHDGVLRGMLMNYSLDCKTQLEFLDISPYRKWIKKISKV